jgi:hypothetical protein
MFNSSSSLAGRLAPVRPSAICGFDTEYTFSPFDPRQPRREELYRLHMFGYLLFQDHTLMAGHRPTTEFSNQIWQAEVSPWQPATPGLIIEWSRGYLNLVRHQEALNRRATPETTRPERPVPRLISMELPLTRNHRSLDTYLGSFSTSRKANSDVIGSTLVAWSSKILHSCSRYGRPQLLVKASKVKAPSASPRSEFAMFQNNFFISKGFCSSQSHRLPRTLASANPDRPASPNRSQTNRHAR